MEAIGIESREVALFPIDLHFSVSPYERLKAAIVEAHLPTAEHSIRVRICANRLGSACKLTGDQLTKLAIAAEIHDIGKVHVSSAVLDKREALTESDWDIIRQHPRFGADMAALAFPHCPEVPQCVIMHHERLDGSGYPNRLRGSQIPILPRIVAVADAFVALTEDRPFRRSYDKHTALSILFEDEKGRYDPFVLELLRRIVTGDSRTLCSA